MTTPVLPPFPAGGLRSEGLRVRIWEPARDAADWLRAVRDPDEDRWGTPVFVPRPVNLAAAVQRLEQARTRALAGEPSSYAVVAPGSSDPDALLGFVTCRFEIPAMLVADVGYSVLREARGRGVATGALRLLVEWLLDPTGPGLARVQLDHVLDNEASCRVAVGGGLAVEGVRRGYLPMADPSAPAGWSRFDVCMHGRVAGTSSSAEQP